MLLKTILDSITEGVFTVDKNLRITFFNRAAERITGFSRKAAIGEKCFKIFRANICQTECALKKSIESGKSVINLPITIVNKAGKQIPVNIRASVLKDKEGHIIGGVETFVDLSAIEALKKEVSQKYTFEDIISKNHHMQNIFEILPQVAESDSTVLIQGPSGSGKGLLARVIHNISPRRNKPYLVVNCAALPETLLESELFGYVKGAFTNAQRDKPGRFALAEGGTILLDEAGDIPPAIQVKLLRVLEEREYEPLGAVSSKKANVRIIAATNKNLAQLVEEGKFRRDLYYRLNVIKIELPPLSQRREDIPLLIDHFIKRFNLKMGKNILKVSQDVMDLLMRYDFPGNVRELENILEHAFVLCRGQVIEKNCLPKDLLDELEEKHMLASPKLLLKEQEAQIIKKTLEKYSGHRGKTATALGIDRSTLWRKMKKYNIHY
ncbi:MAG: sigma 54-interacting transcriptional regulator [Candidatus Desulfofervidaceae bacterium]|nr:sigma 54-interacting transcriptional regulator [Candidatus Desulfofervidaceae bacterium]